MPHIRRLYGLAGSAPLRDATAPPRRPHPGRGRGRPPTIAVDEDAAPQPAPLPERPLSPLERRAFDTSGLEAAMAFADAAIRRTRRSLEVLRASATPVAAPGPVSTAAGGGALAAAVEPEAVHTRQGTCWVSS